jgi:glyoxylase-like metal-dependent hydrolase (beta-lactamase superfamily II)/rhodanese-related sulfurtransferase
MYIQQLYTNCLAEAAYYIESNGEAAIIDPMREFEPYIELAQQRKANIKYIFETHFHADFISGHIDLAAHTGAQIVFGANANPEYKATLAQHGALFSIGNLTIKVLHTPGHTPESVCYLLFDENKNPHAVFTGDTLFVGDVGRPDLAVKSDLTIYDLAGMMYDSLHSQILTLPDEVLVYPAHGAGSSCGKNIGKESFTTIGHQRNTNYALLAPDKNTFIELVTSGLAAAPKYFFHDAILNKKGYTDLNTVMQSANKLLNVADFKNAMSKASTILLDTRIPDQFEQGFIPSSINIGLNGQFAPWVGALIDHEATILLIADPEKIEESVLRLARIGYEKIEGILSGGFNAWKNAALPIETIKSIEPNDFVSQFNNEMYVLDVRKPGEWDSGVIENAQLITLSDVEASIQKIDKEKTCYIHCAGGYRSMIAASILKTKGFQRLINIKGGMTKLKEFGMETIQLQTN